MSAIKKRGPAAPAGTPVNPEVAYEASDVNIGAVTKVIVVLVVTVLASLLVARQIYTTFATREARNDAPASPLLRNAARPLPPEPRLQGAPGHNEKWPPEEMRELTESAEKTLSSYGWVDREGGIARIPIEQAMKILAARGLPARPQGETQTETGMHADQAGPSRAAPEKEKR